MLVVVLVLLGTTAFFLHHLQAGQRLGKPALRIVAEKLYDETGKVAATNSIDLPEKVLDYKSSPLEVTQLELNWLPPDTTYGRRRYTAPDDFIVDLSVVMMGTDRTSIHKPQYCLAGQGFGIDQMELTSITIERPRRYELPVMKVTTSKAITGANGAKTVLHGYFVYWFVADNLLTADHSQRMWWMARDLVLNGVLDRWAYVSYFVISPPGKESATYERLKQFIATSVPEFQLTTGGPVAAGPASRNLERAGHAL